MALDKIYTRMINRQFFGTKNGTFPQFDLASSRLEISKRGKIY